MFFVAPFLYFQSAHTWLSYVCLVIVLLVCNGWTVQCCFLYKNISLYLQVRFNALSTVVRVATRGGGGWVTQYRLAYSNDCLSFNNILDGAGINTVNTQWHILAYRWDDCHYISVQEISILLVLYFINKLNKLEFWSHKNNYCAYV